MDDRSRNVNTCLMRALRPQLGRTSVTSGQLGGRGVLVFLMTLLLVTCAPEPTSPSSVDLGGIWTSNAHLFALSQFKMTLTQEADGIVSGGWSAKGDGGGGGCFPGIPCDAFGNLIGRNMASGVALELLGAGKFEGTLVEPSRLRGVFVVGFGYDTITFVRAAR
jgi:hypothetical protein